MRHKAALAGAALAAAASALVAEPSSAATIEILSLVDAGCCSVSDGSKLQTDPAGTEAGAAQQRLNEDQAPSLAGGLGEAGDPITVNEVGRDGSEKAGDSLGPDAVALKVSAGLDDISPDAVSSVTAPEPSVLTRVLMTFADLRAAVLGGR